MDNGACQELAELFNKKAASGLRDVKFYLQTRDDAEVESVCKEVLDLYRAMDAKAFEPLDFGDLRWKTATAG